MPPPCNLQRPWRYLQASIFTASCSSSPFSCGSQGLRSLLAENVDSEKGKGPQFSAVDQCLTRLCTVDAGRRTCLSGPLRCGPYSRSTQPQRPNWTTTIFRTSETEKKQKRPTKNRKVPTYSGILAAVRSPSDGLQSKESADCSNHKSSACTF